MAPKRRLKKLVKYLKERKANASLVQVFASLEEDRGIALSLKPKSRRKTTILEKPLPKRTAVAFGDVRLTKGMVDTISNVYGECPTDHRGELNPHWEQKAENLFCQVLVCRLNPNHRFRTGLCITSEEVP